MRTRICGFFLSFCNAKILSLLFYTLNVRLISLKDCLFDGANELLIKKAIKVKMLLL